MLECIFVGVSRENSIVRITDDKKDIIASILRHSKNEITQPYEAIIPDFHVSPD